MNFDDFIPDKPFKDYPELLQILKDRGFVEDEKDIRTLKNTNYYDLINAYKPYFMENDVLKSPVTLSYLYIFHTFDTNFQSILFKYSVIIENKLKHKLSYVIAKHFGVFSDCIKYLNSEDKTNFHKCNSCKEINCKSYLSQKNYAKPYKPDRRKKLNKTLQDIKVVLYKSKLNPTLHYRDTKNHIPPWILFKNISFNQAIDLYSFLPVTLKDEIVDEWITFECDLENKKNLVKNAIQLVRQFRNVIAHNNNFISHKSPTIKLNLKILPKSISPILIHEDDKPVIGEDDIYSMIISILLLSEYETRFFLIDMLSLLPKESNFFKLFTIPESVFYDYIECASLPNDLFIRLQQFFTLYMDTYN